MISQTVKYKHRLLKLKISNIYIFNQIYPSCSFFITLHVSLTKLAKLEAVPSIKFQYNLKKQTPLKKHFSLPIQERTET